MGLGRETACKYSRKEREEVERKGRRTPRLTRGLKLGFKIL